MSNNAPFPDLSLDVEDTSDLSSVSDKRIRLEAALVEVSQVLVSSSDVEFKEVLRIVCEGIGADSGYLVTADWKNPSSKHVGPTKIVFWHRDGHDAPPDIFRSDLLSQSYSEVSRFSSLDASPTGYYVHGSDEEGLADGLVIPILSRQDHFVGYLGIIHPEISAKTAREHSRILSIFGDLLASYYSRILTEQALRESEERWRNFVSRHPDPLLITSDDGRILYANRASARLLGVEDPPELLQFSFTDFLDAGQQETISWLQQDQARQHLPQSIEHELTRLDGEERIVESTSTAVTFRGKPAHQMVMRDITDRRSTEERYSTFVQTIAEGIFRIDLLMPVSTSAEIAVQVEHIIEQGYLAESNSMMRQFMGAVDMKLLIGKRVAEVFSTLPTNVFDTFVRNSYRLEGFEFSVQLGAMGPRHFAINAVGRVDRGHLRRIWGSCIDITARVEMERRMVAVLEEQQERIGRDLHDGVGQLLTGVRMLTNNLAERLQGVADAATVETARKVSNFAEEASQRVREICRGLSPPQISQEALGHSLESLVSHAGSVAETECTFEWDGIVEVQDREAKVQLYRIAQEAINNTLKHARAASLHVRLATSDERVHMEISDDGVGFDVEQHLGQSIGIYSMQRRANSMRATLSIASSPGEGTLVSVVCRGN